MSSTTDDILHYQRKLVKYSNDPKVLLHCLGKLSRLPIAVQHLQETGIGKTVNAMRKADGQVGEEARTLVQNWKAMVAAEDTKSDAEEDAEQANENAEHVNEDDERSENVPTASVYEEEAGSRHSKHSKKSKKSDVRNDPVCESPHESTKSSSKKMHPDVDSSTKSKQSKSSHRSRSPSAERDPSAHVSKHKSGAQKSSRESKSSSSKSQSSSGKSKRKHHSSDVDQEQSGEDSGGEAASGLSFAQALGSIGTSGSSGKKKKAKDKDREKDRTREKHKHDEEKKKKSSISTPAAPQGSMAVPSRPAPAPVEIRSTDFEISPHYRPSPQKSSILMFNSMDIPSASFSDRQSKKVSDEEALSVALALKGCRTKVFSGKASSGLTHVPRLFDFCLRVLQENIDSLEYTGGVPFDLLKPVLERATAQQLYSLENFNPYLLQDTDELWRQLCQKECRSGVRDEMETWRDLYLRCHEEREARLKSLTANIQKSMAKATPVRTTKLAYVDSVAKGPRGSGKLKNGSSAVMASITKAKGSSRPFEASSHHGGGDGGGSLAEVVKMPQSAAARQSSSSAPAAKKAKVAPLMQKTLKFIKNRYRR